jgi:hypothetical protein
VLTVRRGLIAAAAVLVLVAMTACTNSSHHHATTVADTRNVASTATVRTATCADWHAAGQVQRWRLVRGMRAFFGGKVDQPGARGQVLPNARAYRLFTTYCRASYASAFDLYRIYGNAAAFTIPKK